MIKERNVIFHVGLHKTGTSYLQNEVFVNSDELLLIRGTNNIRQLQKYKDGQIVLFSDESFSGNLFGGDYLGDFFRNMKTIEKIFGKDVKIIFGLRKPGALIKSIYKQYVHEGGTESFDYIFNLNDTGLIKIKDLFYQNRIEYLRSQFNDVFIYEQRTLMSNFQEFSKELAKFMGIESSFDMPTNVKNSNVGIKSNLQFRTLIFLNRLRQKRITRILNRTGLHKLTFRFFCQNILKNVKSKKFEFPHEVIESINLESKEDWDFALQNLSYSK
jgi:hypothetical protein